MEKRDRDQNVVQPSRDRQNLHKILERKAELAVRGEKTGSTKTKTKLRQTWRSNIGKRQTNSDIAHSCDQSGGRVPAKSQLQQANQWADQAPRRQNKLVWRIGNEEQTLLRKFSERLPRKRRIAENLLRSKQIERDKQELMSCPCIKKGIPTTVSQLLTQVQDLQNKVNSLSDVREFYDCELGSSSGAIPRSQSTLYYSEFQDHALP